MRNLYIIGSIIFILTGCSSKLDIKESTIIPEQALGKNSKEYSITEQIIKNNPHWDRELENETLKFNMYVQDTFNEIDNKKEYLKKIYNVQYYNFDEKGFNNNKNTNNPSVKQMKPQDDIKSKMVEKSNETIQQTSNNDLDNPNPPTKKIQKENKSYDSQIFNEYNF